MNVQGEPELYQTVFSDGTPGPMLPFIAPALRYQEPIIVTKDDMESGRADAIVSESAAAVIQGVHRKMFSDFFEGQR